jgi:hypothetical protein
MEHSLDSLRPSGKSIRRPPIEFRVSFVEPERESRLGSIRWMVRGFMFEVAICIAVVLASRLLLINGPLDGSDN